MGTVGNCLIWWVIGAKEQLNLRVEYWWLHSWKVFRLILNVPRYSEPTWSNAGSDKYIDCPTSILPLSGLMDGFILENEDQLGKATFYFYLEQDRIVTVGFKVFLAVKALQEKCHYIIGTAVVDFYLLPWGWWGEFGPTKSLTVLILKYYFDNHLLTNFFSCCIVTDYPGQSTNLQQMCNGKYNFLFVFLW